MELTCVIIYRGSQVIHVIQFSNLDDESSWSGLRLQPIVWRRLPWGSSSLSPSAWRGDDNHDELHYYNLGEHHGDGNDDNKGEVDDRSHSRPPKSCASPSKAESAPFSRGKSRMEDLALSHLGWEDLTTVIKPGLIFFLKVGLTELSEEDSAVGNFISSVQGSPIKWVVWTTYQLIEIDLQVSWSNHTQGSQKDFVSPCNTQRGRTHGCRSCCCCPGTFA